MLVYLVGSLNDEAVFRLRESLTTAHTDLLLFDHESGRDSGRESLTTAHTDLLLFDHCSYGSAAL